MSEASAPAEILDKSDITLVPRDVEEAVSEVRQSQDIISLQNRQRRKIEACLSLQNNGELERNMSETLSRYDTPIDPTDHIIFLQKLKNKEISQEKVNKMLSCIASPLDRRPADPDEIARMQQNLNNNSQGRAFIAHIIGKGMDQRDSLSQADLILFYENNPLPSTLEDVEKQKFLDELERVNGANGPQKRAEYELSITQIMRDVYGKRMEYFEQYNLLKKDATSNQQIKHDLKKIPDGVEIADYFETLKEANLKARGH